MKGDAFTARELAEAMENRGWKTVFLPREGGEKDWRDVGPQPDVLVSMLEDYVPGEIRGAKAGLLTVAWARNWFAKWMENPAMEDYGLVLATGETIARRMASRLGREVRVLPIAANTARFSPGTPTPEEREKYGCDYCFTGNRFSAARGLEEVLAPEEGPWRFRLFGDGWQEHPRLGAYACGHVAYEEMPALYRCARIVLDDATPSTREAGSVNSRVFDALAAGCLVLTNNGPGARETFEGKLPVFTDRASLQALLRRYLEDEEARREKVRELSALVRKRHTYALRAQALEGWIAAWQAEMRSMEETENR